MRPSLYDKRDWRRDKRDTGGRKVVFSPQGRLIVVVLTVLSECLFTSFFKAMGRRYPLFLKP
jgi:hypothetical protein